MLNGDLSEMHIVYLINKENKCSYLIFNFNHE